MELVKLEEKEFSEFALNHEQATFLQTLSWAKLKEKNGWEWELIGFKDKKKIVCATMILSKNVFFGKKMFYAPRGFLIDYKNDALLDSFVSEIKKYLKKKKAIFLKIDPYIIYHERDVDGKIVDGGIDNSSVVRHLYNLGFREQCSKPGEQSLQANWMYVIDLHNRTFDDVLKDMNASLRRTLRKNEKNGVVLREGTRDDLPKFKEILDHTSERRNFISRSLTYYQNMFDSFGDNIKLYFVDLKVEEKLLEFKKEKKSLEKNYQQLLETIKNTETKISDDKLKEKENEITRLEQKIANYQKIYDNHGSILTLSAVLYFIYGREVLSFIGGDLSDYLEFQPFATMHYDMIKYAIDNKYDYYNMYGISSDLTEKDPMYGVYEFKKKFGGSVVELIGEYDLKIDSFFYYIYKIAYFVVHKLKKIKTKLH